MSSAYEMRPQIAKIISELSRIADIDRDALRNAISKHLDAIWVLNIAYDKIGDSHLYAAYKVLLHSGDLLLIEITKHGDRTNIFVFELNPIYHT